MKLCVCLKSLHATYFVCAYVRTPTLIHILMNTRQANVQQWIVIRLMMMINVKFRSYLANSIYACNLLLVRRFINVYYRFEYSYR